VKFKSPVLGALLFAGLIWLGGCATTGAPDLTDYRAHVKQVVNAHDKELRECYYKAIDEQPMSEGKVIVSWVIGEKGEVKETSLIEAGPRIKHVYPCIASLLKTINFGAPKENGANDSEVNVGRYPFFFSENGKKPISGQE
jgi:hypothetical protein